MAARHRAGSDPGCEVCRGRATCWTTASAAGGSGPAELLAIGGGDAVGHRCGSGRRFKGRRARGADGPHPYAGGGRPRIQQQPGIQAALEALVDPLTRGDPTSPLRRTCKSRAKLAAALGSRGERVSSTTVGSAACTGWATG